MASVEVSDRMHDTRQGAIEANASPDLHRADEAYSVLAHLARARRELVTAVQRAADIELREGHLVEARRRAEQVRDAAELALEYFEGKVTPASLEEQVAAWAEEDR